MALTGAAGAFADRLAERAADGICNLVTGLWDREGTARRDLFANAVEPVFGEFRKIHDEYERTFREYRELIREREDSVARPSPLLDRIRTDLDFGETRRVDLLALLRTVKGTELEAFVTAIVEYLVSTEELQGPSDTVEDVLARPTRDLGQKQRNSLIADLETVTVGNSWTSVLDPYASAPPLYGDDLDQALADRRREHGIAADDPNWEIRLRQALAVEKLDARHRLMIDAYSKVSDEYQRLRRGLLA